MWTFLTQWALSSFSVAGTLIVLGFLYRDLLLKWLYRRVEHDFSERIEIIKSGLRKHEQEMQSHLSGNQKRIEALYGTVLALSSERQSTLDKRRIEAVERIWKSAVSHSTASASLKLLEPLKFEELQKSSPSDLTKIGKMYELLGTTFGVANLAETDDRLRLASEERPFVSVTVWANYSAFHALIIHGVMMMTLLSKNAFDPKFVNIDQIRDVIKKVLPHHGGNIDTHGISYCYLCAPELLDALLLAVQQDLEGKHQDAADVARANEILKAVYNLNASIGEISYHANGTHASSGGAP